MLQCRNEFDSEKEAGMTRTVLWLQVIAYTVFVVAILGKHYGWW